MAILCNRYTVFDQFKYGDEACTTTGTEIIQDVFTLLQSISSLGNIVHTNTHLLQSISRGKKNMKCEHERSISLHVRATVRFVKTVVSTLELTELFSLPALRLVASLPCCFQGEVTHNENCHHQRDWLLALKWKSYKTDYYSLGHFNSNVLDLLDVFRVSAVNWEEDVEIAVSYMPNYGAWNKVLLVHIPLVWHWIYRYLPSSSHPGPKSYNNKYEYKQLKNIFICPTTPSLTNY